MRNKTTRFQQEKNCLLFDKEYVFKCNFIQNPRRRSKNSKQKLGDNAFGKIKIVFSTVYRKITFHTQESDSAILWEYTFRLLSKYNQLLLK